MDFKHKGITWVGNMYQKFEAVCQEVDSIINQDTVKYVENQVSSASENVKKFYSDVVQGLVPPMVDPVNDEAKAVAQRGRVPINAYFKSPSRNEGKAANNVASTSSVGHGTTDQIDKWSPASCKVTFVNEEVSQVPSHSIIKNADLPLGKNDDVWLDKDLDENVKENAINELLSERSDGTLTEKHAFKEPEADDPLSNPLRSVLSNPLRSVSSEINHTNKRASLVSSDDSDLQLEDDTLFGNNDGVLTDEDANKSSEDASDPLNHVPNLASCQVKVTNEDAISVLDDSHLSLESSRISGKNDEDSSDEDSSDEDSDVCSKNVVIMEPDASDRLDNNHLNHVWSGTNFTSEEATLGSDDSKSEVFSEKIDDALTDKDFDKSPIKDAVFEDDFNNYLLNLHACSGVNFTNEEAIMVSDSNHLQLESEPLSGKNDDALTDKYSNESLKEDTIFELDHDASYPLKNQPGCTLSSINYKNEEVSSVSNDSFLNLGSALYWWKNSEGLLEKESDASCKEQANLELSTELISHCDEDSIKETLCNCDNECEEDIVTSTGDPPKTSIHGADVESTHKVGQDSSILVSNSFNFSPKMVTTSNYFETGTGCSSNAPDATSSELVSLVLACGKFVEETRPVSTLKSQPEDSLSASRSSVTNFSSIDKPADCETHPSFEVVTNASCENKALETKLASSRSSSLSMQSLEDHASRANESAFIPKFHTSSHVEFSKSTSPEGLSFSTEIGCLYNSSGYIQDAEMETVDLGHRVTLKDEGDIVDCRALHAVSRRTQKLRSYKKRIQDAFSSKKRLAKEYEQLAIWYGDIDLELSTDSSQKLDTKNSSTSYASDSDWELL